MGLEHDEAFSIIHSRIDNRFSADVTRMQKFGYYSADPALGGATM